VQCSPAARESAARLQEVRRCSSTRRCSTPVVASPPLVAPARRASENTTAAEHEDGEASKPGGGGEVKLKGGFRMKMQKAFEDGKEEDEDELLKFAAARHASDFLKVSSHLAESVCKVAS